MKKNLLLIAVLLLGATSAFAGGIIGKPRAVGGRIGTGFEGSYQHSLSEQNMITVDFGLIYPSMSFAGASWTLKYPDGHKEKSHSNGNGSGAMIGVEGAATYDWINPGGLKIPWSKRGEWNWYAGVGADIAYMHNNVGSNGANYFSFGATGRIGVEYNFWFPLQLSFDYRPTLGPAFGGYKWSDGYGTYHYSVATFNLTGLYAGAICLGVRYIFK